MCSEKAPPLRRLARPGTFGDVGGEVGVQVQGVVEGPDVGGQSHIRPGEGLPVGGRGRRGGGGGGCAPTAAHARERLARVDGLGASCRRTPYNTGR